MAVIQPQTSATSHNSIFAKLQFTSLFLRFVLLLVLPETQFAKRLVSKQLKDIKKVTN